MIAAVGRFSMADLVSAVRVMAENANPGHTHELSSRGRAFRHDSGWGALWVNGGGLTRVRSTLPCFDDPEFENLALVETDLAVVHARRAKNPRTISTENTHPFLATWGGEEWGFCHNGEVRDLSQLCLDPSLTPRGSTDSEKLFLHVLTASGAVRDPDAVAGALGRALAALRDFTSVNSFLASRSFVAVAPRRAPGTEIPQYYTMWLAEGGQSESGRTIVSSEPVYDLDSEWRPLEDGSAFAVVRQQRGAST